MTGQWEVGAIAIAATCLLVDAWIRRSRRLRGYEAEDTLCSLVIGVGGLAAWTIARAAVLVVAVGITEVLPTMPLMPDGLAGWLLTLLGVDLGYYWYHRVLHVTNAGWAVHAVHHSSACFNYATALRGSVAEPFLEPWFHLWLLLVGADPIEIVAAMTVNHLYQFCLHTESVGRLSWIDWLLVTPSHHRVHHACDGDYLDRNFGAILIVWDRMFGTYALETRQPVYGLVKPIRSHSPVVIMLEPVAMLIRDLQAQPSLRTALSHLVSRPDGAASPGK